MLNYTKQLAEFVLDTNYEDIPPMAFKLCKRHLLDCTGAALAEVNETAGKIINNYIKGLRENGCARLIGSGLRTSIDNAAFANGILAHAISFDDSGPSHPSVTIVPTLYALGEKYHLDGQKILTAQVLGYEVFQKLNLVAKDAVEMRIRGWHPTGFFGVVSSSLISAKLLGLSMNQTLNAVGIASSMGAGLSQNIGNMTMSLHAGNAARNGIISSILAKNGFTGDKEILEGKFGLLNALAGAGNYEIENLTKSLGNPFSVINPGINIKRYPNCWGHQRVYDGMLHLVQTYDIQPESVNSIECDLQPEIPTYRYLKPKTDFEAKYSLGYGIAMSLIDRKLGFDQYKQERIENSKTIEVMSKIKHVPQANSSEKGKITVKLNNGKVYSNFEEYSKGREKYIPLSDEELIEKYITCAGKLLPEKKTKLSINLINKMEELDDITKIMDVITL